MSHLYIKGNFFPHSMLFVSALLLKKIFLLVLTKKIVWLQHSNPGGPLGHVPTVITTRLLPRSHFFVHWFKVLKTWLSHSDSIMPTTVKLLSIGPCWVCKKIRPRLLAYVVGT